MSVARFQANFTSFKENECKYTEGYALLFRNISRNFNC